MTDPLAAAAESFMQEAEELLETLETRLLDLMRAPSADAVDATFRALHTLKGSGSMFGFDALAGFAHLFETAFDLVREGVLEIDRNLIDLSLAARDHLAALLACGRDDAAAEWLAATEKAETLSRRIAEIIAAAEPGAARDAAPAAPAASASGPRRFHIAFAPEADALKNGMRPDLLIAELAELGAIEVEIETDRVPPLEALDPTLCHLSWRITLETDRCREDVEGVFIFAEDADLEIRELETDASERAAGAAVPATEPTRAAPACQRAGAGPSLRVPAAKLDEVVDQLGELVIVQSRLTQIADGLGSSALDAVVEEVDRLISGLRETTLSIRMLPIETLFDRFRRVVHDLSSELGKPLALETEGGETEVDKNVLDRLVEPLVHMIRNSADHGIEPPERRAEAGKPELGAIRLSAAQEGGEVVIELSDDGGGLDGARIRARAIERGLLSEEAALSETELHQFIFHPGFSTAEAVTNVSGRGVGMDAVRVAIDALGGQLAVASISGEGARVTLRIPLTLSIVEGMLVRLGDATFVIPLAAVEECVEFDPRDGARVGGGRTMLEIRDELVPFVTLEEAFGTPPSTLDGRRVVIVKADGRRIGLVIDDILGQNQTVVKKLSPYHRDVEGLAGATILGDGAVALIVDVGSLARKVARHRADAEDAGAPFSQGERA